MPERAARQGPLIPTSSTLEPLPPAVRYVLRGGAEVRSAASAALGLELPSLPCRSAVAGARAALWLGPDEWLLIEDSPARGSGAPDAGDGAAPAKALEAALATLPHSLVEVSHRQIALAVGGPHAATVLAAGCPLDLSPGAFPVGMCTRTMLAKAEIVLWRTAAERFRIEVWRSFALYLSAFLAEAARDPD
jgi:sarcosine oxidase, subunit gamma